MSTESFTKPWLLLLFQLPTRPTAARVRTWRQLQRLGAVSVKNSGYVLPSSAAAREDFEWLRADIVAAGGEAMLFVAAAADPAADDDLRTAFRAARDADFAELRKAAAKIGRASNRRRPSTREVRALTERLGHLDAIDFFAAANGPAARAAVRALLEPPEEDAVTIADAPRLRAADYQRRTWVTRPRPGIDRFASAWLIQNFIDPAARFTFAEVRPPERAGRKGAVPFDMFGAEFGHSHGGCTFETLVRRFAISAPGIAWLARTVHDLDLKEDAATLPEAAALGRLVEGLRQMHPTDDVLLARGIELIDAYYRSRPADAATPTAGKRRRRSR